MVDIFQHIVNQASITFSDEPRNYDNDYLAEFTGSRGGTTMPPSPGVISYLMEYWSDPEGWHYGMDVNWAPFVSKLVNLIQPYQVTHRSRKAAVSASAARANEYYLRKTKLAEQRDTIAQYAMKPRESYAAWQIMWQETMRAMKNDPVWRRKYIDDHRTSSVGAGHKWLEATRMTDEQFTEIYELFRGNAELMLTNEGKWTNIRYYTGIRARSEEISSYSDHYEGQFERSRIITFFPAHSVWTLFIPDKKTWYHNVFARFTKLINPSCEFILPYELRGKVYLQAAQEFNEGKTFAAYDGSAWDSIAGMLMGDSFHPIMAFLAGHPMVGSGISFTSMLDTMANIVHNRNSSGKILALGDDMNFFGGKPSFSVPYIQLQPEDTKYKYILGVSYKEDPNVPRLCGLKVTSDRSKLNRSILWTPDPQMYPGENRRDLKTRAAWAGMSLADLVAEHYYNHSPTSQISLHRVN